MAEINWTDEAEKWLKDIYDYIVQDNAKAASHTIEEIYNKAQILRKFSEIGYRYSKYPDKRFFLIRNPKSSTT